MIRNIRSILFFLLVWCVQIIVAQDINVESFRLLDMDMTAITAGTMERDQNGETTALIKVVTPEKGFVFEGGMVGIVKTEEKTGEIWVYVSYGIKKISIMHDKLGVLRDYRMPIPIEKARTYEMVLTTNRLVTTVERKANKQYVMFNVTPTNAIVELNGMPLEVVKGYAEKSMPYGTYRYRVSCANYHDEVGEVVVSSEGKVKKEVSLRPNFGWIDFNGAAEYHGAHVYIDNKHIGQLPLKSEAIKGGAHQVKVIKPLYKPYEQQVNVPDNETTSLTVALEPNFAHVTLVADAESEIWVDEKLCGKGECALDLELGEYTVEVKRPSHRTASEVIAVSNVEACTIQLPLPTPICCILDMSSTPSNATVYIDGVEMGHTPLILDNILIGSHQVTFKNEGYKLYVKTVMLDNKADNVLSVTLDEAPSSDVYTANGVSFAMIPVKGGMFMMGATSEQDEEAEKQEKPAHQVRLSDYSIGETEVTRELWQAVMGGGSSNSEENLQCPIEDVSWNDCQKFIKKLNLLTGEKFRLPTEAEWEYAARGGMDSKGYKYSGGNVIDDVAWRESEEAQPVKTKMPNELGIYDMSGNVWEWCADRMNAYSSSPQVNPVGPSSGPSYVLRGGAYCFKSTTCRVSFRLFYYPDGSSKGMGFRLAR